MFHKICVFFFFLFAVSNAQITWLVYGGYSESGCTDLELATFLPNDVNEYGDAGACFEASATEWYSYACIAGYYSEAFLWVYGEDTCATGSYIEGYYYTSECWDNYYFIGCSESIPEFTYENFPNDIFITLSSDCSEASFVGYQVWGEDVCFGEGNGYGGGGWSCEDGVPYFLGVNCDESIPWTGCEVLPDLYLQDAWTGFPIQATSPTVYAEAVCLVGTITSTGTTGTTGTTTSTGTTGTTGTTTTGTTGTTGTTTTGTSGTIKTTSTGTTGTTGTTHTTGTTGTTGTTSTGTPGSTTASATGSTTASATGSTTASATGSTTRSPSSSTTRSNNTVTTTGGPVVTTTGANTHTASASSVFIDLLLIVVVAVIVF